MTTEHVLLPTDESEVNRPTEERTTRLAPSDGAHLTVLHVVADLALPFGDHTERLREKLEAEATSVVERVVERAKRAGIKHVDGIV